MNDFTPRNGGLFIGLSLLVAMGLTVVPMPEWAVSWRPDWVALVLIYWCMALPNRVGVGVAWLSGLLVDVLRGALFGQYALAYAVMAFIALRLHQRVRVFPVWQQAFTVMLLVAVAQMLVLWVKGITGLAPNTWLYWAPVLTSALLWPWVYALLRVVRQRYRVS